MNDETYILAKLKAALILMDVESKKKDGCSAYLNIKEVLQLIAQLEAEAILGDDVWEVK